MDDDYRITFADGDSCIIAAASPRQAIAAVVRNETRERDIVKIERWACPDCLERFCRCKGDGSQLSLTNGEIYSGEAKQ
jgi:hypothetical protein